MNVKTKNNHKAISYSEHVYFWGCLILARIETWSSQCHRLWFGQESRVALLPLQIKPQHDLDVQPVTLSIQSCGFFVLLPVPDFFEDGLPLPAQAYLKVCSAVSEASLNDMKPSGLPATTDSPAKEAGLQQSGTTVQRTSVLHTQEIVSLPRILFSICTPDYTRHLWYFGVRSWRVFGFFFLPQSVI